MAANLNNLAALYQTQGKYAEAEPLFQRSFWIVYNGFGPEYPFVHIAFANYQRFLKASRQPHTEGHAREKLRSSKYAPTNKTLSP